MEKINLEVICFLKTDKIRTIFFKKRLKAFLPISPIVGTVISQSKT